MINVHQEDTIQILVATEPWADFSPTADVSASDAKLSPVVVPKCGAGWWPIWQVGYYFSAGTAKTATLRLHARDADTHEWRALATMEMIHEDATTTTNGQSLQFEAPARHDRIAIEIDLTNADERPHLVIRGAAYMNVVRQMSGA